MFRFAFMLCSTAVVTLFTLNMAHADACGDQCSKYFDICTIESKNDPNGWNNCKKFQSTCDAKCPGRSSGWQSFQDVVQPTVLCPVNEDFVAAGTCRCPPSTTRVRGGECGPISCFRCVPN
jgi:hypothetical protein